ncbi:MAG: hypothetical protein ACO20Y_06380 [Poseidonia sp.]
MPAADDAMLEHFFAEETQRRWVIVRRLLFFLLVLDIGIVVAYRQGTSLEVLAMVLVAALVVVAGVASRVVRTRRLLERRLRSLLAAIEMDWGRLGEMDLTENEREMLHHVFAHQFAGAEQANVEHRRQRGMDEKGPAFDDEKRPFAKASARKDPAEHESSYEGLEGPLLQGETLLEEANANYAETAQQRWIEAEQNDPDMVEAGVERLGDLVASGWFEKHPKDGAVGELMKKHQREKDDEGLR